MAIGQRKVWDAGAHYKEGDHNASTCVQVCPRIDIVAFLTPSRPIDGEDERGGGDSGCGDGGGLGYTSISHVLCYIEPNTSNVTGNDLLAEAKIYYRDLFIPAFFFQTAVTSKRKKIQ